MIALASVLVPARNAELTLPDTLAALAGQRAQGRFEVIVADDGSTDATRRIAERSSVVDQTLILSGVGPAQARNAAAAAANGDALVFLDADCRPTPGWLAAGISALRDADLVLGETRPRPDQPLGPFDRTLSVAGCSPLFEAANLFVRRSWFERLGGFENWLGPADGKELGEDVWFGWSARRGGARIRACPEALVHHAVFRRDAAGFIAERWRLRFFPALARRVPELRQAMFYRSCFLDQRAARFDAAILGLLLSGVTRRPILAAAALPYARTLRGDLAAGHGGRAAAGRLAADAVGLLALTLGSLRYRTVLL